MSSTTDKDFGIFDSGHIAELFCRNKRNCDRAIKESLHNVILSTIRVISPGI